jgi:hypothetical protein
VHRPREPKGQHGSPILADDVHGPVVAVPELGPILAASEEFGAGGEGSVANGIEAGKLRSLRIGKVNAVTDVEEVARHGAPSLLRAGARTRLSAADAQIMAGDAPERSWTTVRSQPARVDRRGEAEPTADQAATGGWAGQGRLWS